MLDQNLKTQVIEIFKDLAHDYVLDVEVREEHPSREELIALLSDTASCSDRIKLNVKTGEGLVFEIIKDDTPSRIKFQAVPNGHEFTTLLMAILNLDGKGKNIPDATVQERIKAIDANVQLDSYISLTCTNCPTVVQCLNLITIFNPKIKHNIIDGGINTESIERLDIQAVPTVFSDDELLHVGRSSLIELIEQLEAKYGSSVTAKESVQKDYDVIIVGGGPAGASAAIYSARKGFSVALIADKLGGQLNETLGIENLISVPYITGPELTANIYTHLKEYPIDIYENRMAQSFELQDGYKVITTSFNERFKSPALIIATGASWRKLGVEGEQQYMGNGVAFCTHCDAPFYKDKKVVVVGGGNTGLEGAIDLSGIASEVTVLEYAKELKGDQVLQNKLAEKENVRVITSAATGKITGDGKKVTGLSYVDRTNGEQLDLPTDGVFVQIGLQPNTSLFANHVQTSPMGEIIIDPACRTNIPGVYAAGDVTLVPYKQIVVAVGEGAKAALSAFEDSIKGKLIPKSLQAMYN